MFWFWPRGFRRAMEVENARLREEAARMAAKLDAECKERERVEAEQREAQRIEAQRIENERREKEAAERAESERIAKAAAEKAAAEKAAKEAPDREKLRKFGQELDAFLLTHPLVEGVEANDILSDAAIYIQRAIKLLLNA